MSNGGRGHGGRGKQKATIGRSPAGGRGTTTKRAAKGAKKKASKKR